MSGRPAPVRSRDLKAIILAAKKGGAKKIEVGVGPASYTIHLGDDEDGTPPSLTGNEEIKL
jgi:hypothetical protein